MRRAKEQAKALNIRCSSGEPQTATSLQAEGAINSKKVQIKHHDLFFVKDGVDVPKLLRGTRATLYDAALYIGGNVLVDEQYVLIF